MAYVFIDDGNPESGEYDSNYFWLDPADPKSVARLEEAIAQPHAPLYVLEDPEFFAARERELTTR